MGFRNILLMYMHSEYASQLVFLPFVQFAQSLWSALCAAQPTISKAGVEMHAKKKSLAAGRRNTPAFKHYDRLEYQQVFDVHSNSDLFKKLAERMKEGGCVR